MLVGGCERVVIDIAGFPVGLGTTDRPLARSLQDRYRHFLTSHSSLAADFVIDVVADPPCGENAELDVRVDGSTWRMTRGDFDASWNAASGCGRIRQTRNPYSTDSVLRIVHSVLLSRERGLLVHASSLVLEERAFLFTGPSGSGKTTIASLAPSAAVLLTDEISCVRSTPRGWLAYGTPFAGELGTSGTRVAAPLAGIFRLEQGAANRILEMPQAHAVRTLMRNILFFGTSAGAGSLAAWHPDTLRGHVLDTACSLAADVPVSTLTFRKESGVWDLIDRHVPGLVRA
jgi:hypothetical protein